MHSKASAKKRTSTRLALPVIRDKRDFMAPLLQKDGSAKPAATVRLEQEAWLQKQKQKRANRGERAALRKKRPRA